MYKTIIVFAIFFIFKTATAQNKTTHTNMLWFNYNNNIALNKKWNISATWVYSTGNAVTFPSGKYYVNGRLVPYFTERNGYRMPDYHRLDVGVNYTAKKTKKLESSWNFSVYNLYNRKNAYQITFEENPDNKAQTQAVRTALFGIIPSATWNFKF